MFTQLFQTHDIGMVKERIKAWPLEHIKRGIASDIVSFSKLTIPVVSQTAQKPRYALIFSLGISPQFMDGYHQLNCMPRPSSCKSYAGKMSPRALFILPSSWTGHRDMNIGIWIRKICVGVESSLLETSSERLYDWFPMPSNPIYCHAHVHIPGFRSYKEE